MGGATQNCKIERQFFVEVGNAGVGAGRQQDLDHLVGLLGNVLQGGDMERCVADVVGDIDVGSMSEEYFNTTESLEGLASQMEQGLALARFEVGVAALRQQRGQRSFVRRVGGDGQHQRVDLCLVSDHRISPKLNQFCKYIVAIDRIRRQGFVKRRLFLPVGQIDIYRRVFQQYSHDVD